MTIGEFEARRGGTERLDSRTAVTITGLSGNGSAVIGAEIARITGRRLVDDEIRKRMCEHLKRTPGELMALEESYRTVWGRVLKAFLAPYERYGTFADRYAWSNAWVYTEDYESHEYLTLPEYFQGLKSVVGEFAIWGNVVMHGHEGRLFTPAQVPALHVFVTASDTVRRQRISAELGEDCGLKRLAKEDRDTRRIFKNLLGSDLLDMRGYDVIVNSDRLSYEEAAREGIRR